MDSTGSHMLRAPLALCFAVLLVAGGCQTAPVQTVQGPPATMQPRELSKAILPAYRIEPPDVLVIEAVRLVPRPPYRLRALDLLHVQVQGTLPDAPINGVYRIEPEGWVKLGSFYGAVGLPQERPIFASAGIDANCSGV